MFDEKVIAPGSQPCLKAIIVIVKDN